MSQNRVQSTGVKLCIVAIDKSLRDQLGPVFRDTSVRDDLPMHLAFVPASLTLSCFHFSLPLSSRNIFGQNIFFFRKDLQNKVRAVQFVQCIETQESEKFGLPDLWPDEQWPDNTHKYISRK